MKPRERKTPPLLSALAAVAALALQLSAIPAEAQFVAGNGDPQAPVVLERFQGTAADFRTVQLFCASDTAGDYISNALCTVADTEVRKGARDLGINFRSGSDREDGETFTVYVHITSAGTAPRGMSVRVEASRYYGEAIDQAAPHRSPAAFPRSGKLVFFEETITGVGQGDSLEEPLRRRLRTVVGGFFRNLERSR